MKKALATGLLATFMCTAASAETLQEYCDRLIAAHGANATVSFATMTGIDKDGQPFNDRSPPPKKSDESAAATLESTPDAMIMAVGTFAVGPFDEDTCEEEGRPIIVAQQSGPYIYRWCWSDKVVTGETYEAKRDFWGYWNGRTTYINSVHFNCQNSNDLAAMPDQVKADLCYQ